MAVLATAAAMEVAMEVVIIAAAMEGVIIALMLINLLEQKVGKTEVMEILLKTLNTKVAGVGEKEEFLMRVMLPMKQINNPFLQDQLLF